MLRSLFRIRIELARLIGNGKGTVTTGSMGVLVQIEVAIGGRLVETEGPRKSGFERLALFSWWP